MIIKRIVAVLSVMIITTAILTPAVYADTNGNEILITNQPDRLVLQLGTQWAGVEFQLKTDAGVFPAPVVVDSTGILEMDLGGSKVYTLSCVGSSVAVPNPEQVVKPPAQSSESTLPSADDNQSGAEVTKDGIPIVHLILFLVGLLGAVGGLVAMRYFRRRRETYYQDDGDEEEE